MELAFSLDPGATMAGLRKDSDFDSQRNRLQAFLKR